MEKWDIIFGVDVSKLTIDISCAGRGLHIRVGNDSRGFARLRKWFREHGVDPGRALFVMEYTGGYEYRFLQHCQDRSYDCCRVPGLEIKQSVGMTRGKSDRSDSFRIGRYGEEKSSRLEADKPLNPSFVRLRELLAFRKRLVRESAGYKATVKEREAMYGKKGGDALVRISRGKIKANDRHVLRVEGEIASIINADASMRLNYGLITSIRGIGRVNAWMTIAYTENFTSFADGRKYAVYAGVIPFEHTSGTSVRGRKRVSHLANKEVKQELNQAAKVAMAHEPDIREYAQRKLGGKPYPLVLNNVKFKLILRMFSLVRRGEKYVENYKKAA